MCTKSSLQMESFVRFRCQDELFSNMMARAFGTGEENLEEKYSRAQVIIIITALYSFYFIYIGDKMWRIFQDGSDDEIAEPKSKMQKRGKFTKKHEVRVFLNLFRI